MSRSPPGRQGGGGEGEGGDQGAGPPAAAASGARAAGLGRRRIGDPSSSRPRSVEAVWPEHFVEAVAARVAVDAARYGGRLAAAPAVVAVFQVCSTWRGVSSSELLWQDLAGRVWSRRRSSLPSWRDEFVHLHRTAANFRARRSAYSHLLPPPSAALSCRRLTLSDRHLAAGFLDGSVRLFRLPDGQPLATYRTDPHRDRFGRFSQAVSGIVLVEPDNRLAFASQDGDVHVASLGVSGSVRRAHEGNVVEDGTLVDFTGNARRWVGLFSGVPERSWHVWDAAAEQLVYVGGILMDLNAVLGWHALTDLPGQEVGRVRMAEAGVAVGCTASSMEVVDLEGDDAGATLNRLALPHGAVVGSVDACEGRVLAVDARRVAVVRGVPGLQEMWSFSMTDGGGQQGGVVGGMEGCMNWGYAVVCSGGEVRLWDAMTGEYLYSFRERIGEAVVAAASDRYVVAWANDTGLHLWDFGAL